VHAFDSHALPPFFIQHSPGKYKSLNDSRLYLLVSPSVGRLWRFKYIYGGKEKLLALGIYRMVGLSAARQRRDDAKRLLESGVDPSINRKAIKAARDEAATNSFETVARESHNHRKNEWTQDHAATHNAHRRAPEDDAGVGGLS